MERYMILSNIDNFCILEALKKIISNPHPSWISQTFVTLLFVQKYGPWILSQPKTVKWQVILYISKLSQKGKISAIYERSLRRHLKSACCYRADWPGNLKHIWKFTVVCLILFPGNLRNYIMFPLKAKTFFTLLILRKIPGTATFLKIGVTLGVEVHQTRDAIRTFNASPKSVKEYQYSTIVRSFDNLRNRNNVIVTIWIRLIKNSRISETIDQEVLKINSTMYSIVKY